MKHFLGELHLPYVSWWICLTGSVVFVESLRGHETEMPSRINCQVHDVGMTVHVIR